MKINWNRKYTTIAVYTLIVVAICVIFNTCVNKFGDFMESLSWFGGVAAPVICGLVIAYVINPLMMFFENKVFRKLKETPPSKENIVIRKLHDSAVGNNVIVKELEKHSTPMEKKIRKRKTMARVFSIILSYLVVIGVIVGIIFAVVPALTKSVSDLVDQMPTYIKQVENWAQRVFEDNPQIAEVILGEVSTFQEVLNKIAEQLKTLTQVGNLVNASKDVMAFVGKFLTSVKNFVIGLIIAIYLLYSKEKLLAQVKKIIYAMFKVERCESFFKVCSKSNDIFKMYIISNLLDSMIIFVFMMIGMFAMNMPYQMLIAVVCAVTNLIPFFGPFIGAIPCGFLILLVDPIKVLWFAIFVLVVQQVDGNVMKPFLFGETMGLPAIWVLVSIIVGGGMFGLPGMLLGAPVFAVFYMLFADFIKNKLGKKNMPGETEDYTISYEDIDTKYVRTSPVSTDDIPVQPMAYSKNTNDPVKKPNSSPLGKSTNNKKKQ